MALMGGYLFRNPNSVYCSILKSTKGRRVPWENATNLSKNMQKI